MNRTVANEKRLIRVTKGNLAHQHIYIREHYDFFTPDCIGPCRKPTDLTAAASNAR